jgi:pimeloyl-ACP methyl ester carboxylesterase
VSNTLPSPAPPDLAVQRAGRSIFVSAPDGLRLHIREYGSPSPTLAVVCLPGLARTTADFDALAPALASGQSPHRVIAVDSRGRGQSQYDNNPQNYNVTIELADLVAALRGLDIGQAVFIGSSRGGILTMLLAAAHPTMVAGAVLHDIGPKIEAVLTYDPALAETLADFNIDHPLPPLWEQFDALARVPVLVIRGANSDILSAATAREMQTRHRDAEIMEIPDQGHVPLLDEPDLINRIAAFVERCEYQARL